ncbi:MAG: hypothetical protein ACLFV7_01800 [Phycisphaerae bacterium]
MFRNLRFSLTAALCLLAAAFAPPDRALAGETAKLTCDTSSAAAGIVTPVMIRDDEERFSGTTDAAEVKVAGESILLRFSKRRGVEFVAVDVNGDDKLSADEVTTVNKRRARVKIKVDGEERALNLSWIAVYTKRGKVTSVYGRYAPGWAMTGRINGTIVRLVDCNLDGKYTQDGKDVIAVGTSSVGIPLRKVHQIGKGHYRLRVAEDGSSIDFEQATDLELGLVKHAIRSSALKMLVLSTPDGKCYDLVTSANTGVPAGTYKLEIGVLVSGDDLTPIVPSKKSIKYEIQPGKLNILRLGTPLHMSFSTGYSNGYLSVGGPIVAVGDGGEHYPNGWNASTGIKAPRIQLFEGRTKVKSDRMGYT